MNIYWTIAGGLMVLGGLAHTVIGEGKVIRHLKGLKDGLDALDDEQFNLIRWFWYLGSWVSFWVGGVALMIGLWDGIFVAEKEIGLLLASLMAGFSVLTFGIVAVLNPRELGKLAQVVILIVVTVLLWVGAM